MSSVAWASFLTGCNPAQHGVFGFVEAEFDPHPRLVYPNRRQLHAPTLLDRVRDAGGTVVSINVPMTGPPIAQPGVVIGGFLGGDLPGNVHPPELAGSLREAGYVVDTDPALAHENRDAFLTALDQALEARIAVGRRLAMDHAWDLYHLHLMETDRLFHFYWDEPAWVDRFDALLLRAETAMAEFAELAAQRGAAFVTLSDHGFTRTRRILFVNRLLARLGLLMYARHAEPAFATIDWRRTRVFALAPGRLFLTRPDPGLARELADTFTALRDPDTGDHPIESAVSAADLYHGPFLDQAAPVHLLPQDGIDLKADFSTGPVFETPSVLVGCHTYGNAYAWASEGALHDIEDDAWDVADTGREVVRLLGMT